MKNKYEIVGDCVHIQLSTKVDGEHLKTIISIEDLELVDAHTGTWGAYNGGRDYYVQTKIPGTRKHMKLARLILCAKEGQIVDHINGNTLDNRRCNLRFVTRRENRMNARVSKNNKSGITGVNWDATEGKWSASIYEDGKQKRLGHFGSKESAIKARKLAEKELASGVIKNENASIR